MELLKIAVLVGCGNGVVEKNKGEACEPPGKVCSNLHLSTFGIAKLFFDF
jgi:hypothetical protein